MNPIGQDSIHFAGSYAPNCGVVAISIMTGTPFDKVWQIMRMERNGNWKGRTVDEDRSRCLSILGYEEVEELFFGRFDLTAFVHYIAHHATPYMVYTKGHVQVVHRGTVTDQKGTRVVNLSAARNDRVQRVTTIRRIEVKATALASFLEDF